MSICGGWEPYPKQLLKKNKKVELVSQCVRDKIESFFLKNSINPKEDSKMGEKKAKNTENK